jgi:hypothetical protein
MPEATTYRVQAYYKLARDEHGMTQVSSLRLDAASAIGFILADLPDDAWSVEHKDSGEPGWDIVTAVIDWSKVPEHLRAPKLPTRNGRRI